MRWIIDRYMLERAEERHTGQPTLEQAAKKAGHEVYVIGRHDDFDQIPFDDTQPVVTWGSHQFAHKVDQMKRGWIPGTYHRTKELAFSSYASHIGKYLLNDDFILLPFAEVKRRMWNGDIFIRPDSVTKTFAGFSIREMNIKEELSALEQIEHIDPETMIVIARAKQIKAEFRFVIVEGNVVTGSEYRWDGVMDVRIDVHPDCQKLAEVIAKNTWQPDIAYTCDVALMPDETVRVIELNTFTCSGLYACNTLKIVDAVSKAAWNEFRGDIP